MAATPESSASTARRLWLSLCLPRLSLDALRAGAALPGPGVVTSSAEPRARVRIADARAQARGVRAGMTLSAAHALAPGLRVLRRDTRAERGVLEGLASWAGRFTSCVSVVPEQGLLLEVGGSLRLFGGLDPLVERVRAEMRTFGYAADLAVAPTALGAWLLARSGLGGRVTQREHLAAHLAPVPLECLGLDGEVVAALRGMGLRRFDDCHRLPRDGLARRAGPEVLGLIDRALGRVPDPRRAWRPPARFDRSLTLPTAVDEVEGLLFATRRLLLELSGFLALHEGGVRHLALELRSPRGTLSPVALELLSPSRDPGHLLAVLRERLSRLPPGPQTRVERLRLRAPEIVPLAPRNLDLFAVAQPHERAGWQALVERLRARLGAGAVQGLAVAADHRPERAWRYCVPGETGTGGACGSRPLWLLSAPRALETVNGRPCLDGALSLRPRPERIESGWWDGRDVARDYFVARNPGGQTFWVFRERQRPTRWFLHGIFA